MIPQDGTGYGRSLYWEMKTKQLARKNNEFCHCWDFNNPVITFSTDGTYKASISCEKSEIECRKDFHKTDEKLTELFKRHYKD